MNRTIVCTGPIDDVAVQILKKFGEIVVASDPQESAMLPLMANAIGMVVRGGGMATANMMRSAPNLKVIGRPGAGYDSVDLAAAGENRIAVVYAPGLGARAVAE